MLFVLNVTDVLFIGHLRRRQPRVEYVCVCVCVRARAHVCVCVCLQVRDCTAPCNMYTVFHAGKLTFPTHQDQSSLAHEQKPGGSGPSPAGLPDLVFKDRWNCPA